MKIGLRKWKFFGVKEFFFINFDFKNGCKNEFKGNNEKSCSWSRNRVSFKIDFKAVWPRNGHAASVRVNHRRGIRIFGIFLIKNRIKSELSFGIFRRFWNKAVQWGKYYLRNFNVGATRSLSAEIAFQRLSPFLLFYKHLITLILKNPSLIEYF